MLESLSTEKTNPSTTNLDRMSVSEILQEMNREDKTIPAAIKSQLPKIESIVDDVVDSLRSGGRLIYIGAGTSGRLGVLDAVECEPTFGVSPDQIFGLIAGGQSAMFKAVEGAEDSAELGAGDLKKVHLQANDTVIGIAASGRTPYVIGGLQYAKEVHASVAGVVCNLHSKIAGVVSNCVELDVGPEILTGSTRLKSGTAQKMVLNMISTTSMVKLGKVYGNLMVDLKASNVKLIDRAVRIIIKTTGVSQEDALTTLKAANMNTKVSIVMLKKKVQADEAVKLLDDNDGMTAKALGEF